MILSVINVRQFYDSDEVTEAKLQSLESLLQDTTNNNFVKYKNAEGVIDYPVTIIDGFARLIEWEVVMKPKLGIASESLSRHSVSYTTKDSSNMLHGYPLELLGFMKLYTKARF